ncbi:MAG TPA: reverse transcriptase N-terminal domain-containing protein, partial [Chloroflexota bacterium]
MQPTANGPESLTENPGAITAPVPTDWNMVNWRMVNRQVRNLRRRIFRASQQGDWR